MLAPLAIFHAGCRFGRKLVALLQDRQGGVGVITALCVVPLVGFLGLAVDYSVLLSAKAKLDHAADAAAIAGIVGTQSYLTAYTGSSDVNTAAEAAGVTEAVAQFKANTGAMPGGSLSITTPAVSISGQVVTGTAGYTYTMPNAFMKIFGIQTSTVSGSSTTSLTLAGYSNIYIVIDVSSSMGIGATAADQKIVYNVTGGCAVACHYDGSSTTARSAGATLRIDVAKQAVIAALTQMQSSTTASKYKVAVYTMSDTLVNVFALSSSLSSAITAVNNIDLSNSNYNGGTDSTYVLSQLNALLPTPGNGLTSATAKGTVMLLTDGVQDSDMKYLSKGSYVDTSDPNFSVNSPCNQASCEYFSSFGIYVEAFNPATCTAIKTKGYQFLTLNVTYLVPSSSVQSSSTSLNDVFTYINSYLLSTIPTNMAACATSTSNAYSASTPAQISAAVSAMFASVGVSARITQ